MKSWLHQTKKSLLIGSLSFILMFSIGHVASAKSSVTAVKIPWKTEASHRQASVHAYPYLTLAVVTVVHGFHTPYPFAAGIDAHTRQVLQRIKLSDQPLTNDLLLSHHTCLKIAPGKDEEALLLA